VRLFADSDVIVLTDAVTDRSFPTDEHQIKEYGDECGNGQPESCFAISTENLRHSLPGFRATTPVEDLNWRDLRLVTSRDGARHHRPNCNIDDWAVPRAADSASGPIWRPRGPPAIIWDKNSGTTRVKIGNRPKNNGDDRPHQSAPSGLVARQFPTHD